MFGVYIHIPYCQSKCNYCDFYSIGASSVVPEAYVDAIIRDIEHASNCSPLRPSTVYFGGGTPSLLAPKQARRILSALCCAPNAEITLEANPETVTIDTLHGFLNAGINRLSVGVQTANDESLARLGRKHTSAQSKNVLKWATDVGFKNISGDIMLALPSYTLNEMNATIDLLLNGGCTHISSYMLKIEQNTVFAKKPPLKLPDDDKSADFYLECVNALANMGINQYEISNFAKEGFESKHNLIYWNCQDYLGFGPTAHSCYGKKRFSVPKNIKNFIECEQPAIAEGQLDVSDYIMLKLRLNSGISLKELCNNWSTSFNSQQMKFIETIAKNGLAKFDGDILSLTPQGMLLQNSIVCQLI